MFRSKNEFTRYQDTFGECVESTKKTIKTLDLKSSGCSLYKSCCISVVERSTRNILHDQCSYEGFLKTICYWKIICIIILLQRFVVVVVVVVVVLVLVLVLVLVFLVFLVVVVFLVVLVLVLVLVVLVIVLVVLVLVLLATYYCVVS